MVLQYAVSQEWLQSQKRQRQSFSRTLPGTHSWLALHCHHSHSQESIRPQLFQGLHLANHQIRGSLVLPATEDILDGPQIPCILAQDIKTRHLLVGGQRDEKGKGKTPKRERESSAFIPNFKEGLTHYIVCGYEARGLVFRLEAPK